jgi:hypothetical protein
MGPTPFGSQNPTRPRTLSPCEVLGRSSRNVDEAQSPHPPPGRLRDSLRCGSNRHDTLCPSPLDVWRSASGGLRPLTSPSPLALGRLVAPVFEARSAGTNRVSPLDLACMVDPSPSRTVPPPSPYPKGGIERLPGLLRLRRPAEEAVPFTALPRLI